MKRVALLKGGGERLEIIDNGWGSCGHNIQNLGPAISELKTC